MSRNWREDDFDSFERHKSSSRGRKHDRREKRHDSKHHLRDIKDMVNNGEELDDDELFRDLEDEE